MKRHQAPAGQIVLVLLSLSLLTMPVACAPETTVTASRPAPGSTVTAYPAQVMAQSGGELDTTANSTPWVAEAVTGVLVILGLSEALRRHYRARPVQDLEMNSWPRCTISS